MCDHGHGGCAHEAEDVPPVDEVFRYDMYHYIDMDKVTVLNEAKDGSGKLVFKSMDEKFDKTLFVESDCDEELLFNIPFSSHVKLSGMALSGPADAGHPAQISLFKDRPAMSFDDTKIEPDQVIDLKQDPDGLVDYALKASRFSNVTNLTIHVRRNFGAEESRIYYIGLRGEYKHEFRSKIAIATYEARPIPEDHKGELPDMIGKSLF